MQPVLVVSWKTGPTKSNRSTECTFFSFFWRGNRVYSWNLS